MCRGNTPSRGPRRAGEGKPVREEEEQAGRTVAGLHELGVAILRGCPRRRGALRPFYLYGVF